jgi:hypothetical protein
VERAQRGGGLHKRSAEAWGHSLCARGDRDPLGFVFLAWRVAQEVRFRVAFTAGTARKIGDTPCERGGPEI